MGDHVDHRFARQRWERAPSLVQIRLETPRGRWVCYGLEPVEEFETSHHVFLKVIPKRGVVRFGKQGELSPRYIGPFEILERVGTVVYRLVLLPRLSVVK